MSRTVEALDLESRADMDDHEDLRLWLRMLSCTALLETSVRKLLGRDFATTLPRFDLLAQLEREPAGMRMGELSRRLMVTGGNITTITDSLVKDGLVRREPDPDDRRSWRVRITPRGLNRFRAMANAHETMIIDLFSCLSARQKQELARTLKRLKSHVRAATAGE